MGLEKVSMSLAQKTAAWIKAAGKKSLLEIKPSKIKVDAKNLGYVSPDGTINFQSSGIAQKYAKNRAMLALKDKNPHERFIIVDKNRILDEIEGGSYSGVIIPLKYKANKLSIIHGHPDLYGKGNTSPISVPDASTILRWNNLDKIVAYNTKGEFSILKKIDINSEGWFADLRRKFRKFTNIINSEMVMIKGKKELTSSDINKQIKEIDKKIYKCLHNNKNPDEFNTLIEEKNKLVKLGEIYQMTETNGQMIHEFWLKYAKKYNLEYATNFSNLSTKKLNNF